MGNLANARPRIAMGVSTRAKFPSPYEQRSAMHRKQLLLFMLFLVGLPVALCAQQKPIVIWENKHDVSPPLRSMPIYHGGGKHREMEPWRKLPMPAAAQSSA